MNSLIEPNLVPLQLRKEYCGTVELTEAVHSSPKIFFHMIEVLWQKPFLFLERKFLGRLWFSNCFCLEWSSEIGKQTGHSILFWTFVWAVKKMILKPFSWWSTTRVKETHWDVNSDYLIITLWRCSTIWVHIDNQYSLIRAWDSSAAVNINW